MGRKISELVIKNYYRENYIFPKMKFEFVNLKSLTDKYTKNIEKVCELTFYIYKKIKMLICFVSDEGGLWLL